MAISLNTVNSTLSSYGTRITALENAKGGWTIGSSGNSYYAVHTSGLKINWGLLNTASGWTTRTTTFLKAFTNANYYFSPGLYSGGASHPQYNSFRVQSRSLTAATFIIGCDESVTPTYIAIGYLITNRLLNILYAIKTHFLGGETIWRIA